MVGASCPWTLHSHMVKKIHFVLYILYYSLLNVCFTFPASKHSPARVALPSHIDIGQTYIRGRILISSEKTNITPGQSGTSHPPPGMGLVSVWLHVGLAVSCYTEA